ncbi:MAG: DUF1501 domain-containing protein [Anaerolineae bacterium]
MQHCNEYETLSRRGMLTGGLRAVGRLLDVPQATAPGLEVTFADPHVGPRGDTLVCVFLRGGIDGLNVVVPYGDPTYYDARPTLAINPPDRGNGAVDLDGFFGLHPSLEPLGAIYQAGSLAAVQATGSPDDSHSHFQAMAEMERASFGSGVYSGWLARHLATLDTGNTSALRALSIGEMLPASLAGAGSATVLRSIEAFRLRASDEDQEVLRDLLAFLYEGEANALGDAGRGTVETIRALEGIDTSTPPRGRAYPETVFGRAMQTAARLIRAEVGVEVACLDLGGWDTHAGQGGAEGYMATRLAELANGLAAFYEDIEPLMGRVTVLVMSEFGRRVRENAALGTDHGTGNMMLLMGNGINGGQVYADWPTLHPDALTGPGDLTITTDYRDILGEVISARLNNPRLADVFPEYTVAPRGIARLSTQTP